MYRYLSRKVNMPIALTTVKHGPCDESAFVACLSRWRRDRNTGDGERVLVLNVVHGQYRLRHALMSDLSAFRVVQAGTHVV